MGEREIEWAERIAVLELKVENLEKLNQSISDKLDDLLALKTKGMGAFWLASILFTSGVLGLSTTFLHWLKG